MLKERLEKMRQIRVEEDLRTRTRTESHPSQSEEHTRDMEIGRKLQTLKARTNKPTSLATFLQEECVVEHSAENASQTRMSVPS